MTFARPLLLFTLLSASALADGVANNAVISGSGSTYRGSLAVNQAAGDSQQQANARAIANAARQGTADAATPIQQLIDQLPPTQAGSASARIEGAAFSNGQGVLGINQSAGSSNQQINAFRLANGLAEGLDDATLSQQNVVPATLSEVIEPSGGARIVNTDDRAFSNSQGVVQLNQSAGVGNSSINSLGIRVAP